ncbi:hypothetical protein PC116_g19624 [Phytophthora cactorum]|nr:hypothetical protein PC112_g15400 [Phytophthora cactorum]KAG2901066.1 hypothetical protein PC114_g13329 [Phytophthora cactorum]KAG2940250.1 hypothetical protein PC117_g10598 [Phytophthora cactorum]KAG2972752.1 hypothetical protein PC118_g15521 [Phytophthora cactorum]KAG3148419.1 hypothetical protein C6341_g17405 [Phytophthora cactorum]
MTSENIINRLKRRLMKVAGEEDAAQKRLHTVEAIRTLQTKRRALNRRKLRNRSAWSSKANIKAFCRRVCTKFGDNVIPTLTPVKGTPERCRHDKANIKADGWEPILTGQARNRENIDKYLEQFKNRWNPVDLAELDEPITEQEVIKAIRCGKRGKAYGPDDLNNEWCLDNRDPWYQFSPSYSLPAWRPARCRNPSSMLLSSVSAKEVKNATR